VAWRKPVLNRDIAGIVHAGRSWARAVALARGHVECQSGPISAETRAVAGEAVAELQRLFEASGQHGVR
jgi:hypothetical protein